MSVSEDCYQNDFKPFSLEMRDKAFNICRKFLSGEWNRISSNDMVFKTISGGLSNFLYYCSLPATHTPLNGEPNQVLLRMYGQLHDRKDSKTMDRESVITNGESQVEGSDTKVTDCVITMLLAERNLGPKLYGIFPGGRLEEYIPARAMHCRELKVPVYASAIARKLATVHSLNVPLDKEPTWLWDIFNKWIDVRNPSQNQSLEQRPNPTTEKELCSFDFEKELQWLRPFLQSVNSPTVFCHNDLQEGNILLPEKHSSLKDFDDTIVFIDFEWCAYNYRGFDLGNHFVERMFDYSNPEWPHYYSYMEEYPSDDDKRLFIREYINKSRKLSALANQRATEDQLIKEADYFALASHLLWTLWSINMARSSKIEFGYWEYGLTRLTAYKNHKKLLKKKYQT